MPNLPGNTYTAGPDILEGLLHALNQPLTQLLCSIELALQKPRTQASYMETLSTALAQVERATLLSSVIQEVVQIERKDGPQPDRTDFASTLKNVLEDLAPVAESAGLSIRAGYFPPCPVQVSQGRLYQALLILLNQTLSAARKGNCVEISLQRGDGQLQLSITAAEPVDCATFQGSEPPELAVAKSIFGVSGGSILFSSPGSSLHAEVCLPLGLELT